jgi:hypothetical protein
LIRDKQAYDDDTGDVKKQDTIEDPSNNFGHVTTGILSFSGCKGQNLNSQKTKPSVDKCRPKGQKTSCGSRNTVELVEGVLPIPETNAIMSRSTSQVKDNTKDDQTNNLST